MRVAARSMAACMAAACALLLAACGDEAVDRNANAPGSPGTGNTTQVVTPSAPDGPPGGSSGAKGSLPHTGASGGDAVPGTTGDGAPQSSGQSPVAQQGTGLNGGLGQGSGLTGSFPPGGTTSAPMGAGPADGSTNSTPGSATGSR